MLLINSFADLDDSFRDTMQKSAEVFKETPENMTGLNYHYYSALVNSVPLTQNQIQAKERLNPIKPSGRISLISGLLNSQSVRDRFEKLRTPMLIIHTLKNCLVNVSHAD